MKNIKVVLACIGIAMGTAACGGNDSFTANLTMETPKPQQNKKPVTPPQKKKTTLVGEWKLASNTFITTNLATKASVENDLAPEYQFSLVFPKSSFDGYLKQVVELSDVQKNIFPGHTSIVIRHPFMMKNKDGKQAREYFSKTLCFSKDDTQQIGGTAEYDQLFLKFPDLHSSYPYAAISYESEYTLSDDGKKLTVVLFDDPRFGQNSYTYTYDRVQ